MTIKEACLKVLKDEKKTFTYRDVYNLILIKQYYVWDKGKALTPIDTVGGHLSDLIKWKDKGSGYCVQTYR